MGHYPILTLYIIIKTQGFIYNIITWNTAQVTEDTMSILKHFNYEFEQRGVINVKGKGELMTYYLIAKL